MTQIQSFLDILAGYEKTPIEKPRDVVTNHIYDLSIGRELNRLQGYEGTKLSERIQLLFARGQITKLEAKELILRFARETVSNKGVSQDMHER